MKIIKLDAIDSTNTFLRQLSSTQSPEDFTVVTANSQTHGKGQMGTVWETEAGKNLTCSVFKEISNVRNSELFYVSMAASLAVFHALKHFQIPKLAVKWPNDILSARHKICGILIENVIKAQQPAAAIIGIGLNVNQVAFHQQFKASSLKKITGIHYDLDEILFEIVQQLKTYTAMVNNRLFDELKTAYESVLFRKDQPSTFTDAGGNVFMGFIKGVSKKGKLIVLLEDEIQQTFDLKEIKLLY